VARQDKIGRSRFTQTSNEVSHSMKERNIKLHSLEREQNLSTLFAMLSFMYLSRRLCHALRFESGSTLLQVDFYAKGVLY
jgi:hypothetical protein